MVYPSFMKQRPPRPITISPELAARYANADQFERFDAAVRTVLTVSHTEILRREAAVKAKSALNPNRVGQNGNAASGLHRNRPRTF